MSPSPPIQAHIKQAAPGSVQTSPPAATKPMTYQQRPPQSQDEILKLRGGDRGGACPGRFCFIIPCPFPCDFCII